MKPMYTMPKSVWSMSPGRITWPWAGVSSGNPPCRWMLMEGWNQLPIPSSATRCRIHHSTSTSVVTPGTMTWLENASAMTW